MQHLFQYLDEDGAPRTIDSEDVNAYLREIAGEEFTAKDFRTWAGTVLAALPLRDLGPFDTETTMNENIIAAIDAVAARLGNTRAVCHSSYICPAVFVGYENGDLCCFKRVRNRNSGLDPDEQWTLGFLEDAGEGDGVTG